MARVNNDILGISKLKRTGMSEFNLDDHCIYYCGQESLRRNGVAIIVNKRVWNATKESEMQYLDAISKTTEWSLHFQGKPFDITVIQVYAPTSNAEKAEVEWFYEDLQDLLELPHKKDVRFTIGDWNAKVGSQKIPGLTGKFVLGVQNEAGQRLTVLPRERTGHSKHPLPTTQETTLHMDITRWSILKSDWLYFAAKDGEALYSQEKWDQEWTVAEMVGWHHQLNGHEFE